MNKLIIVSKGIFLFFLLLVFLGCGLKSDNSGSDQSTLIKTKVSESYGYDKDKDEIAKNEEIPSYVIEILTYIRTNNKAPENYAGGRQFFNREERLPLLNKRHRAVSYKEWDVQPKIKGRNRGPERLITSEESAFYTKDHYKTFIYIKETQ